MKAISSTPSVRATSSMLSATTATPFGTSLFAVQYATLVSAKPSVTAISSISSVSADLAHHQILHTCHHITPVKSCYLKRVKKLLVLEKDVSNITTPKMFLRVYDILPA